MDPLTVILVQPPIQDFYLTKKRTIPYGLASIAATVIEKGFQVKIIDSLATKKSRVMDCPDTFVHLAPFYGKKDLSAFALFHEYRHFGYSHEHIAHLVRNEQPFIVGISSLFTAYQDQAVITAEQIKKFYPQCHIVLGGHHPTIFPEKALECSAIDFLIRGEGEMPMAELCTALAEGKDLNTVPGLCFRKENAFHISEPFWMKNLSSLPLPAGNLINHHFYQRNKRTSASIVSSRGCPMQCSYCSVSAGSSHGPYRRRPVEHVIKEVKGLIDCHDMGFIDFEDENLCLNKSWFYSLFSQLNALTAGKNIELRAMNGLYPPSIDEDIIKLMKSVGFKTLNLSLGSTGKAQLEKFNRKDVRTAFESALDLAKKHNLSCVSYIIGAAPGQSAQSSLTDLLYLARQRTLVGFSIYYPAPGSVDFQVCRTRDLLPETFCLMRSTALPIEDATTKIQAVTLLRLSRILNFMKAIKDSGKALPDPEPCDRDQLLPASEMPDFNRNRTGYSEKILQWFLHDGQIRGIDPSGRIYLHTIDTELTRTFINELACIHISGTA